MTALKHGLVGGCLNCVLSNEGGEGGDCIDFSDPSHPRPWGTGWSARGLLGLKFCHRASISLVCQPCNFQPLTLPYPLMAWVTRPPRWQIAFSEVQLRDGGDSNLACDATVSQNHGAHVALAWPEI